MPKLDLTATKLERKRQLADLVASHLTALGHEASVVCDRKNAAGHLDRVLVDSSVGLVHTTASVSRDPNGSILTSDIDSGAQTFLAGKDFVAYGWVDRSGRTLIQFVPIALILGKRFLAKTDIIHLADRTLSTVLPGP